MGLLNGLKQIVYKADLLDNGSLLRVKGEPEHKTLLGGILSISLMLLLLAAFYNKIIDTLDKVLISSATSSTNADDPLPYNITTIDKGNFMFGVEVWHHNLNEGSRYFDIALVNIEYIYGEPQNTSIQYQLQPCTKEHWEGYPEVQAQFEAINMAYWKCLPKNMDFQIRGKYSSPFSKTLSVAAMKCTNNSFEERPCAPQEEIDQFFADTVINYFTIYFINPLINPDNEDFISYYLEDINYIIFSPTGGEEGQLLLSDFTIETDQSILPNSDVKTISGGIITKNAIKNSYSAVTDTYATFLFFKSVTSINIVRNFQKLDNVFSYIGGLFGTIIMLFFMIGSYNTYKFQVNLAGYLYRTERKAQKIEKDYNFLYFVGQMIYNVLGLLNMRPKWQKIGKYYKIREEMLKQLDILYLIKRINFLQRSLSYLFSEQQLVGMHLSTQPTMSEAARIRRNYQLKGKIKQEAEKLERGPFGAQNQSNIRQSASVSNSNTKIDFENLNRPNNTANTVFQQKPHTTHHFDSENYSSDESSSQQQQTYLLNQVSILGKTQQNPTNKKIWKSMDKRIKQIIEGKYTKAKEINHPIIEMSEEVNNKDPHSIQVFDFELDQVPVENINEQAQNRKGHNSPRMTFSRMQTAKIHQQNEFGEEIGDQFQQNSF